MKQFCFAFVVVLLLSVGYLLFSFFGTESLDIFNSIAYDLSAAKFQPFDSHNVTLNTKLSVIASEWLSIGIHNGVDIYIKDMMNSKLLAFRAIAVLDLHISKAMGPFANVTKSLEWIPLLKSIDKYSLNKTNITNENISENSSNVISELYDGAETSEDILHQVLKLPWPIRPRDMLLRRQFYFHDHNQSAEILYSSTTDDRIPIGKDVLRLVISHCNWKCQTVNSTELNDGNINGQQHVDSNSNSDNSNCSTFSSIDYYANINDNSTSHDMSSRRSLISRSIKSSYKSIKYRSRKLVNTVKKQTVKSVDWLRRKVMNRRVNSSNSSATESESEGDDSGRCDTHLNESILSSQCSIQDNYKIVSDTSTIHNLHVTNRVSKEKEEQKYFTRIEIECVVDTKGTIPTWFLNYMQRTWPGMTINTFKKLAHKGIIQPHPRVIDW